MCGGYMQIIHHLHKALEYLTILVFLLVLQSTLCRYQGVTEKPWSFQISLDNRLKHFTAFLSPSTIWNCLVLLILSERRSLSLSHSPQVTDLCCVRPLTLGLLRRGSEVSLGAPAPNTLLGIHTEETRIERDMCTPLPFLNPAWTSESFQFMCYWS